MVLRLGTRALNRPPPAFCHAKVFLGSAIGVSSETFATRFGPQENATDITLRVTSFRSLFPHVACDATISFFFVLFVSAM